MGFFKNLAKATLGLLYIIVPIIGWIALARSLKRINADEVALLSKLNGETEVLYSGLHFRPFLGEKFGPARKLGANYIDLGPKKIVTVRDGFKGVSYDNGVLKILQPGVHTLEHAQHTFDPEVGFIDTTQNNYSIGPKTYIRVRDGQLGVSYNGGQLQILDPGEHVLETANHKFDKFVNIDSDIIDLGPVKIVNVNEGNVAVTYNNGILEIKPAGRYVFTLADGQRFSHLLSVKDEVIDLPTIKFMSTDGMEMETDPLLIYRIVKPIDAVTKINDLVKSLVDLAQTTLQNILKRFSLSDLSPAYDIETKKGKKNTNTKALDEIHDDFIKEFQEQVSKWGVEVSDLKVKEVVPTSAELKLKVQELGAKTATQDAQRKITAFGIENDNAVIKAKAKQQIITANATRDAKIIEATTTTDITKMNAEANADAMLIEAEAQSKKTALLAAAQGTRLDLLGNAAKALTTDIAQQLARGEQDIERIKHTKNPVFYPQDGSYRIWSNQDNKTTYFNNSTSKSSVSDYLDIASTKQITQETTKPALLISVAK